MPPVAHQSRLLAGIFVNIGSRLVSNEPAVSKWRLILRRGAGHFPQGDLDEAASRQAHCMGFRFVRTIASALVRKYDVGTMRRMIKWRQDRECREKQRPILSP
jgi:hypothetical protein